MSERNPDDDARLDPSTLVERAIESVLGQVPDLPDFNVPESGSRIQPWADVATPPGKNKRPLEELLEEYAQRVAAAPEAKAGVPDLPNPTAEFFERFSKTGGGGAGGSGKSRRRRRRGRGDGEAVRSEATPAQGGGQPHGGGQPQGGERGRGRRGESRGPRPDNRSQTSGQPGNPGRPPGGQPGNPPGSAPGTGAKRRRRGRGRGRGGGGGGGAPGPGTAPPQGP